MPWINRQQGKKVVPVFVPEVTGKNEILIESEEDLGRFYNIKGNYIPKYIQFAKYFFERNYLVWIRNPDSVNNSKYVRLEYMGKSCRIRFAKTYPNFFQELSKEYCQFYVGISNFGRHQSAHDVAVQCKEYFGDNRTMEEIVLTKCEANCKRYSKHYELKPKDNGYNITVTVVDKVKDEIIYSKTKDLTQSDLIKLMQ